MKHSILFFLLICSSISLCYSQSETLFNKEALLKHVEILASDDFEGRKTGTKGSEKARAYIIDQFYKWGVKPIDSVFGQPFGFSTRNKRYRGVNLLGLIEGQENPNKYIVITAHYDHLGRRNNIIFNGADDNASGVAALFAFAEYFKNNPPKHSVILAAFDAEELDLKGSNYFINHTVVSLKDIIFNLNMDMISRSEDNELFIVGIHSKTALKDDLSDIKNASKKIKLSYGHDGTDGLEDWSYASDHAVFRKKNIPSLYFGVADHEDYHKATDDFINIHPEFFKEAVHQILLIFKQIDQIKF